ncbi:MAG: ABC transporter ATP-binding protein [Pseudomonadota bacterium]
MVKRLVREYLKPYFGQLAIAVVLMIIAASMTALFASIIEPVMDKVLVGGQKSAVWGLGFAIFIIFFIRGGVSYLEAILMNKIGQSIVANIQNQMFGHFLDLDLKFFHDNPSGQLISRVVNDVNALRVAITSCLTGIGKSLITLILLIGVMFYQDWVLALATLTIFPLAAIFVAKIGKKLRRMSGYIQEGQAILSDRLSQIFQGIRLVKAYGMEKREKDRAAHSIERVKKLIIKSVQTANLSTPFNETLVGLVVFGIIVYGGYQVAAGETTAGELLSFITAFSMSYEPMKKLARLNNTLQMGLGAAERVFDVIDRRAEVSESSDAQDIKLKAPKITLKEVSFGYEGDENKALKNVSLEIPAGKVTALVGRSGSGKTTIMNLIPRFFDVDEGEVIIDQHNIKTFTLKSLRQNIALVSQDITIFDDSVWANIGYGREGASQEDIKQAAIDAEADDFIRELPDGYDTKLGEDGVKLSGGQRQRLSIARAILRDAPILLLDEATSALDNEAERAIQETLSKIQKGRTTLVIAHRLSTVQQADQIIVMNEGEMAELGQHEELLAKEGIYARMHQAGLKD